MGWNMSKVVLEDLTADEKELLLSAFGYSIDEEGFIVDTLLGERVTSKNTRQPLKSNSVAMIPGSLNFIDADPVTLSEFLRNKEE